MGHDKRVDWGMPAILGDDVDARTYYRALQVTKSYSGILAARIFVGLPEVSFCTRDIFIAGTETIQVGVLPRRSIPPLTMVHEEGMLGCGDLCIYIRLIGVSSKELAFRSAILYGGLLISNAFGSVSLLFLCVNCSI